MNASFGKGSRGKRECLHQIFFLVFRAALTFVRLSTSTHKNYQPASICRQSDEQRHAARRAGTAITATYQPLTFCPRSPCSSHVHQARLSKRSSKLHLLAFPDLTSTVQLQQRRQPTARTWTWTQCASAWYVFDFVNLASIQSLLRQDALFIKYFAALEELRIVREQAFSQINDVSADPVLVIALTASCRVTSKWRKLRSNRGARCRSTGASTSIVQPSLRLSR